MEDLFKICGIVNLKKGEGRTIKAGGMWVYDNEIESIMGDAPDGTLVEVHDFDGYFMGIGFINRRSKLTVRMMSRHQHVIDEDFIEQRVRDCVEYRKHTVDMSSCRLVFGEADFLPGIVIDKFSDVLVVESLALGIDRFKPMIVDKLKKVLAENGMNIRGVYERSDAKVRLNEGLERFKGFIGEEFDTKVMIEENGVKYYVDVQDGQKTGFFLDLLLPIYSLVIDQSALVAPPKGISGYLYRIIKDIARNAVIQRKNLMRVAFLLYIHQSSLSSKP